MGIVISIGGLPMSNPDEKPVFYATTAISTPVVAPNAETTQMNGFAFSMDYGMLVALQRSDDPFVDNLSTLRKMARNNAGDNFSIGAHVWPGNRSE
jgi:hypothetical protein